MRIALSSAIDFWLSNVLGSRFLMAILKTDQYEKLRKFSEDAQTFAGIIFLFVIPSIPKDLLCYLVGASVQRFFPFLAASMIARMQGILGSTLAGSAAYNERFGLVIALAVGTVFLMIALMLFRERIEAYISRHQLLY